MLRNFFSTPNVIGRLLIVLLFVGGLIFAGAFNGFVVQTDAKSCCGGGTDVPIFSSGSNGCECLGVDDCGDSSCSGCSTATSCKPGCCTTATACNKCSAHCRNKDSDEYMCDGGC